MVGKEFLSNTITEMRDTDGPDEEAAWTDGAFEQVFAQNHARLIAVLFRLVGNRARAEELANDSLWKLYKQGLPTDQPGNVQGWLYRTATRLGIDALRARARRHRYEQAAAADSEATDDSASPLDDVLRAEAQRQVREVLSQLKPAQARILILRNSGFSYQELAQALGVKKSSVGTLLNRAEAKFEKFYRKLHGDKE